jgi:hypothetical protein
MKKSFDYILFTALMLMVTLLVTHHAHAQINLEHILKASTTIANEMEHKRLISTTITINGQNTNAAVYLKVASQALIAIARQSKFMVSSLPSVKLPSEPYAKDTMPTEAVYLDPLSIAETIALAKQVISLLEDLPTAPNTFQLRNGRARLPDVIHHLASTLRFYHFYNCLPRHLRLTVISTVNLFPWTTPNGYEKYTSVISGWTDPWNLSYYMHPAHYFEAFSRTWDLVKNIQTSTRTQSEIQWDVGKKCYDEMLRIYWGSDRYWFVPPFESKYRMTGLEAMRYSDFNSAWHNTKMNTFIRAVGLPGAEWRHYVPGKGWVNTDVHDAYGSKKEPEKVVNHDPPWDIPWESNDPPPSPGIVRLPQPSDRSVTAIKQVIEKKGNRSTGNSLWLNFEDAKQYGPDFIVSQARRGGFTTLIITLKTTIGHVAFPFPETGVSVDKTREFPEYLNYQEAVSKLITTAHDKGLKVFGGFATLQDVMTPEDWRTTQPGLAFPHAHVSPCKPEYQKMLKTMLGKMLDKYPLDGIVLGQLFWADVITIEAFNTKGPGCDTSASDWYKTALSETAKELIKTIHEKRPGLPVWLTSHPFRPSPDPGCHYSGEQDFAALAALADGWIILTSDNVYLTQEPDPVKAEVERLQTLLKPVLNQNPGKRFDLSVSFYLADEWTFPAAYYDGLSKKMAELGVSMNLHSPISADGDFRQGHSPLGSGVAFSRTQWKKIGDMCARGSSVLVLDRSGSMEDYASNSSQNKKIDVLKDAADQFIRVMKPDIGNHLGLVQFNEDVVPFTLSYKADLSPLTEDRAKLLTKTTVPSITQGGCTSIGDGLTEAYNQLIDKVSHPGDRKAILLVTDGLENEPDWIDDIDDKLIASDITVYPLGLGYSSGIDEKKLTALANATNGDFRITSNNLIFRELFLEILVYSQGWSVITDPSGKLSRGDTITVSVPVTDTDSGVTFTTLWEGADNAIKLTLISPSGIPIDPHIGSGIRYVEHPRYAFYQLDFPLRGKLSAQWAGQWKLKLTNVGNGPDILYSAAAYAETSVRLDAHFDKLSHKTGDKVLVTARLSKGSKPLTGAALQVFCDIPLVGAGNILHQSKIGRDELQDGLMVNGDIVSLIGQKIQLLSKHAGKDILERDLIKFRLYDDGNHGDGNPNDGTYANTFPNTKIPGSYTFRFVASGIPTGEGQHTTREWTKSFYNEVNTDAKYSVVDVKLSHQAADGKVLFYYYDVNIAPRDKFGNYLGPGHPVTLTVTYPGASNQPATLNDNIDGTYTQKIRISQDAINAGAKLVIDVGGKTFTTIEKLPTYMKWSVSIHSGATFPTGNFGSSYNSSYMFGLNIDHHFTPQFSMIGFLVYNHFRASSTLWDDTYLWNLSANLKYEFPTYPFRPYINGGAGIYIPKNGSIKPGVNVGLGLDYSLNANWTAELGGDYHHIFTSGSSMRFFVTHAGLIYRF